MHQHSEILVEMREWFSGGLRPHHSEEAAGRFAVLQLRVMEIIIMQLSELNSAAQKARDTLSQLEADVGALVQRAGQNAGGSAPSGSGLSANDQATIDSVGETINSMQQRMESLRTQVVGIDQSGNKVAPPSTDGNSQPEIVTAPEQPANPPPAQPTNAQTDTGEAAPASTPLASSPQPS